MRFAYIFRINRLSTTLFSKSSCQCPCHIYRYIHTFPNEEMSARTNDHIRSALYPLNGSDYPTRVHPDLNYVKLFRDIELLKENCSQRQIMVDINSLASDYDRWRIERAEFRKIRKQYYEQEEQQQTQALSDTGTDQKVPKRKQKKSNLVATEQDKIVVKSEIRRNLLHNSEMVESVDEAWIDSVNISPSAQILKDHPLEMTEFNQLKEQYDKIREEFRLFDHRFTVACLRLPNALHISVPHNESGIVLYESPLPVVKHAFNSKSWNELCHVLENNDASPFGTYWLGMAPLRKHELIRTICNDLNNLGFEEVHSMSVVKPFICEALGDNINDSRQVLTLFENEQDSRSHSFIMKGLGSLDSLLAPFVRRSIHESDLPYVVYSQGPCYDIKNKQTNKIQLLAMTTLRDVHLKNIADPLLDDSHKKLTELHLPVNPTLDSVMNEREKNPEYVEYNQRIKNVLNDQSPYKFNRTSSLDDLFLELTRLIYRLYENFKLPFRIRNCSANQLQLYEALRLQYEIYLPSSNDYVGVGSVSLLSDYVSRRLMIRYKKDRSNKGSTSKVESKQSTINNPNQIYTNENHVQMIHAQFVDIDQLVKCYVEKEQRNFSQST